MGRVSGPYPPTLLRSAGPSLFPTGERCLNRRLAPTSAAPIAVALSGGGDSVALLALAADWAARHGRPLLALIVDHGLQPQSAAWAAFAADLAARLGAGHRTLVWTGAKPTTGLAAAARFARHRLLAAAAREAGACVILFGHTADDRLEAAAMRADGVPLGELTEWSPSPVWPEGRGLMLLRPLLDVRRAALRAWLRERGLPWIEDPANADPRSMRARARAALTDAPDPPPAVSPRGASLLDVVEVTADGRILIPRAALRVAADARRVAAAALACASGGDGRLKAGRVDALLARLASPEPVVATLGGARVDADAAVVSFARDAGETKRDGLAPIPLGPTAVVWDGRFEAPPADASLTIAPLRGRLSRLPSAQRRALDVIPPAARAAVPALVTREGAVACPTVDTSSVVLRPLVAERLSRALGGVDRELA